LNITGYEGVENIQLPKDTVKHWAFVNTVMNIVKRLRAYFKSERKLDFQELLLGFC